MANGASGNAHRNWVVQKFGGTSVGKFCLNIIDQIIMWVFLSSWACDRLVNVPRPSLSEQNVAVVCSARSNLTKAEGTTNL